MKLSIFLLLVMVFFNLATGLCQPTPPIPAPNIIPPAPNAASLGKFGEVPVGLNSGTIGRPMQNAYIERFNKTYRGDILDAYLFENLEQLRILSDEWMFSYNNEIPHGSLKDLTPNEYAIKAVNCGKLPSHKTKPEFTTINSHNSSNNRLEKYKLALS